MNQKTENRTCTLKLALLAASLLSSGAVQAFPDMPLGLPPPAFPDITVEAVSILFTPGTTVSNPGILSVTKTGTTGFFLNYDVELPSTSSYSYNLVVETETKTDPNLDPTKNNALLSGTLQILDDTNSTTLLAGTITAFSVTGSGDTAAFEFLLDVTQSLYNYGPRAAIALFSDNLNPGLSDISTFSGTGNLDNYNIVPEPGSLVLFAAGGMVLFASKRRCRVENMI